MDTKKKYITILIILLELALNIKNSYAQQEKTEIDRTEELIALSKQKWQSMADKNVDSLDNLFHGEAVFVHMGATMNKEHELNTIRSGRIQYKYTEIQETSIRFVGNIAIILNKIRLIAIVGGNEVINPFMVTEVYVPINGKWKFGSLSFTRLIGN